MTKKKKKIPKYFLKAIKRRTILAQKLIVASCEVDEWLEKEGLLYEKGLEDAVTTGVMIFVEPKTAENLVLRFLKKEGYE